MAGLGGGGVGLPIGAIAQLQSDDRVQNQTSQNIVTPLNQLLKNPVVQGNVLAGVSLGIGQTIIKHGLGRTLQGWIVTDVNAIATIYRSQPLNAQTLALTSSAAVKVNLYVF